MARRVSLLALLAALAIGGCTYGQPADISSDQEQARIQFIEDHPDFDDHELARLCPGLYPSDFLTSDDFPDEDKDHRDPPVTAQDRAQARAAGCDVPSAD
jgi:hypothetical protein